MRRLDDLVVIALGKSVNPQRLSRADLHDLGMPDHADTIDPADDEDAEIATDDPCWEDDEYPEPDDDEDED